MNHRDVLLRTAKTVTERTEVYGDPADTYSRASIISTTILGKEVSRYDVAIIMHAVKLSRILTSPKHLDNYEDGINFLAFAAEFVGAGVDGKPPLAQPGFNRGPVLRPAHAPTHAQARAAVVGLTAVEQAIDQALSKSEDDGA
jgi:hypothetical protein